MKSSFKRKLVISYGVSLLLLIVSSVASYISIRNLLDSSQLVGRTNKVLQALENVVIETINAETGQRGILLTGDERFSEHYNGARRKALQFLEDASYLIIDNSQQKNALILRGMIEERFSL